MDEGDGSFWDIEKTITFEASHQIAGHKDPVTGEPGKCSRLHGHTYSVSVVLSGEKLQPIGFLIDYYWLGQFLKTIHERYDHWHLNDFEEFQAPHNATAERIAQVIYRKLRDYIRMKVDPDLIEELGLHISYVQVKETESTAARYYE